MTQDRGSGGPPRKGAKGPPRGGRPPREPAGGAGLRAWRGNGPAPAAPPQLSQRPLDTKRRETPDDARHAAALLLWQVLEERRSLEEAMSLTDAYRALSPRDRGFAAAITLAGLRRLGQTDAILGRLLAKPLPETAHYVRALLRLAAGQWLSGLAPDHAIASSAVALARADRLAYGMAGLVNAIIRRMQREVAPATLAPEDALSPAWRARWQRSLGPERLKAAATVLLQPPSLDLSCKTDPAEVAEAINHAGIGDGATVLPGGSVRLAHPPGDVTLLPGWAGGAIWVQDAAARLPVHAMGDVAGLRVLDMCAAPGGKTLQLAASGAVVTALDADAKRLARVSENLERTGLTADCHAVDARTWEPEALFDAVLLDAPCSATGTGRRHPEAQWIRDPRDVVRMLPVQADLIVAAARLVKPGGTVVFAICSLEAEEHEAGLAAAASAGLVLEALTPEAFPGLPDFAFRNGCIATAPDVLAGQGGMDGFFVARFRRRA